MKKAHKGTPNQRLKAERELRTTSINLGRVAMGQENDAQAEAYLQEALEIARQIKRHRLLCEALSMWGELYLKQQQWVQASSAFGEVRDIATEVNQEFQAEASYGLARVAAAQGDSREARALGQASLHIAETIGSRLTVQVRAWLEALPPERQ
jgi:uncharacterized protein HemY